ncbi:MAG: hypothetical protein H7X97_09950, partial [Opitutaceae bacterium]|nr:hypothetical protein [Verrucomicrobiales bacterium]
MRSTSIFLGAALVAATSVASAADKIDFNRQIKPIIESSCLSCHGVEKPKGELQLDTREHALKGGENKGSALVAGNPAKSPFYTTTILPPGHDDIMPPKGATLSKEQTEMLRLWIEQGADWPAASALKQVRRIDFVKDVQPILEFQCVACHREGHDKGKLRLDVKSEAFKHSGAIVPGYSDKSAVYTSTTVAVDDEAL